MNTKTTCSDYGISINQSHLITKADLKTRGWTDGMINRFAAQPDRTATNPHHANAPPMKLYRVSRVKAIEGSIDFAKRMAALAKRRTAMRKSVANRRKQLIDKIQAMKVAVPRYSQDQLFRNACKHYNSLWLARGECGRFASPSDDSDFLKRIAVNYIRHCLTLYDSELVFTAGKIGAAEARFAIKERVLAAIAETYPWLADECLHQSHAATEAA